MSDLESVMAYEAGLAHGQAERTRLETRVAELEAEVCDAAFAGHMIGADRAQERIRELEAALNQAQAMLAHFDQENDRLADENKLLNASREDWKGTAQRAQAALALEVKARVACAEIAHEAKLALAKAEGDATSLLFLLAQIREAVGDNGKRMQNELVDYCRDLRRSKDTIQAALGNGADEAAWEPGEHYADAAARKIIRAARETPCTR